MKNRPYEKNKFSIPPNNNKNDHFYNQNFLSYSSHQQKEKSTNDDSNNLMRSMSNVNTAVNNKEDKTLSLYENDEFCFKELSELSLENSNNERIISERNFVQNNFHFKIPNSNININKNKNKNYNVSPEFFPSNFNPKTFCCINNDNKNNNESCSSSSSSSKNSSASQKSNCNSIDNGQEKYLTDKSLPDISNIDLNEWNKSLKNILITPNSLVNTNPFCSESPTENGNEKIKEVEEEDYLKDCSESTKRKKSILNSINNSYANANSNNLKKYCLQTPFIPKNLLEQQQQQQLKLNYFGYIPSYNNFQFNNNNGVFNNNNNNISNANSSSAQAMFNYKPNYLNYDLSFAKINSSPILNSNSNLDNFEEIKHTNLNEKENSSKNNLNNKTAKLNISYCSRNNFNNFTSNSFNKLSNNNFNIKSNNPTISLNNPFINAKERDGKPRINRNNLAEEPHNKINLENVKKN